MVLWIWKKDLIKLLKIYQQWGFAEDCLEVYENRADHLNNNLVLQEIFILIFFQFYCKINWNQSQIVVQTTYCLYLYFQILYFQPILILSKTEFKILRKKPGDKTLPFSLKFPKRGWDQRLTDFNRFSKIETQSCYSCLVL